MVDSLAETLKLKSVKCLNALATLTYPDDEDVLGFYHTIQISHEFPLLYKQVMQTLHGKDADLEIIGWPQAFYKIMVNDVANILSREETTIEDLPVYHYGIGRSLLGLAILVEEKLIRHDQLRVILQDLMSTKWVAHELETYLLQADFLDTPDVDVSAIIRDVISKNSKAIAEIKGGKTKAIGSLMGQVLKQYKGDPKEVQALLLQIINEAPTTAESSTLT